MISGLVIHLVADDANLANTALQAIRQEPTLELGPRELGAQDSGPQELAPHPAVLETETAEETQQRTDWIRDFPGVAHVDVTFVHFEETTLDAPP